LGRLINQTTGRACAFRWESGTGGNQVASIITGSVGSLMRPSNVTANSGNATWPAGAGFYGMVMPAASTQRTCRENQMIAAGTSAAGAAQSAVIAGASLSATAFVHHYACGVMPSGTANNDNMMEDIAIAVNKAARWMGRQ